MTANAPDAEGPLTGYEHLLRTTEELDTPDGFKAELIRGKIVVSPWSRPFYKRFMKLLREQLQIHAPEGHDADVAPFLFSFPTSERAYGPDLHVADEKAFETDGRHVDGEALSLVAELTSVSTRDVDWQEKLAVYGRHVPVYLVLDMGAEEITAFWNPSNRGYLARATVPFGKPLQIPAPFDFDLDTTGFTIPEKTAEDTAEDGPQSQGSGSAG